MAAQSNSRFALSGFHNSGRTVAGWLRFASTVVLIGTSLPSRAATHSAIASETADTTTSAVADKSPVASPTSDAAPNATASAAINSTMGETLLLGVEVNGHSLGVIGEFILYRNTLMARPDELRALGFRVPDSRSSEPLVPLSALPGLTWNLDLKKQELYVTGSNDRLLPMHPDNGRGAHEDRRVIESGTGVTLNYDVAGSFADGQRSAVSALDVRAFSPLGIVSSGWLTRAATVSGGAAKGEAIRLDSVYTFADVNTLRRYGVGDFVTGALAWTRPVRLEGAQVRSDFSMRPDLVTFPLPSVTGSAAVPSTVTVLMDGNLVVSNQVSAGPFEIPQLPVITGGGMISMTVTNALGQQVTLTQPFYASSALLAPGLQTFSAQSGLVRRNWGSISNDYGEIAGAALYRRGLTSKFTVEGALEGTPGTFMAGAGGVAQIANLGVLNFAAAVSTGSGHPGAQFSLGAQRIGRKFSMGASGTIAGHNYRDVAAMNGDGVLRKQLSAFASVSLKRFGSVGIAYGGTDQDATLSHVQPGVVPGMHSHVVSASYSRQFHHISIYATEYKNIAGYGGGLQFGLTVPLGRRGSVDVSATSDGHGQLQVQQSATQINEWGYQAYVSAGDSDHEFGQVQYKSPAGLFTAGADRSIGHTTFRVESQGALSFVDRGWFASNTIYDSFAIVDTSPVQRVHVLQENRDVGSTNSSGRLLVPDMRSFDLNHISIVPTDVPPDATINVASVEIRPQDRSGVVVSFPIKFSHGALLRLIDEAGAPTPLGSTVTLRATGATFPVGYDGDVYLENLSPHNELSVDRTDGRRCRVAFDYNPAPGDIPSIGPLRCIGQ